MFQDTEKWCFEVPKNLNLHMKLHWNFAFDSSFTYLKIHALGMIPLATPILQERAEVEAKSKIAVVTHLQDFNFYLKQFLANTPPKKTPTLWARAC